RLHVTMKYCHRCGTELHHKGLHHVYECAQGHIIYANASPAVGAILLNDKNEVLIMARGQAPGIGALTIPGGFCNGAESIEDGLFREIYEETRITRKQYGELTFITSGIDHYDADHQVAPVSAVMFMARLHGQVTPVLDIENQWYTFVPLKQIDPEAFYSITVRAAFRALLTHKPPKQHPALLPPFKEL
ncbi:MAG TPA: NUDIX domain-containing protein, partial [Candidatus Saccharimonadales bacterium]|nr:NUDIX domain-containing protein [Candidatus Saccharimonadales bacterium]